MAGNNNFYQGLSNSIYALLHFKSKLMSEIDNLGNNPIIQWWKEKDFDKSYVSFLNAALSEGFISTSIEERWAAIWYIPFVEKGLAHKDIDHGLKNTKETNIWVIRIFPAIIIITILSPFIFGKYLDIEVISVFIIKSALFLGFLIIVKSNMDFCRVLIYLLTKNNIAPTIILTIGMVYLWILIDLNIPIDRMKLVRDLSLHINTSIIYILILIVNWVFGTISSLIIIHKTRIVLMGLGEAKGD